MMRDQAAVLVPMVDSWSSVVQRAPMLCAKSSRTRCQTISVSISTPSMSKTTAWSGEEEEEGWIAVEAFMRCAAPARER